MEEFSVPVSSIDEFSKQLTTKLSKRALGKITNFNFSNDLSEFYLQFNKLGKSEFTFKVIKQANQLTFRKQKEKIALSHRPFRKEMEDKLHKILKQIH